LPTSLSNIRQYLKQFEFKKLFIEELGWDRYSGTLDIPVDGQIFKLSAIAQKRSMAVWLCEPDAEGNIPQQAILVKVERQVTKSSFEHLIVYQNKVKKQQLWQFAKREAGRPTYRTHRFDLNQSGESLAQKLAQVAFSLDEEEKTTLIDVTRRVSAAFYIEKITKQFYEAFQEHHKQFLKFIKGIPEEHLQRWYASVMLNRLMFIYFIQKKGFLDNDISYLRTKLQESKIKGKDQFYHSFLVKLFFDGFAKKLSDRSSAMNKLLGTIPYLNGGLFLPHQIEEKYGKKIEIADKVFEHLFDYFDRYQWHLDERPLKDDLEINPDVLGYIFEKYINQKEMGAYYTKEDITGYNSQNTIIPRIFDIAKEKCAIAFEGEHSIWNLLKADPNRYIYEAVKKGTEKPLPKSIAAGINDVSKRIDWNKSADAEYALPTEIWREVVARRQRHEEVYSKLANGEIHEINDFITYNLDIRQFAQDVIENCEGSELLAAFWFAIEKLTVLDPTCGSGAFLFAALNILELLYEACLDRMQDFVDAESVTPISPLLTKEGTHGRLQQFSTVLERITKHPNRRYFIYKSIIVNNLFGVDVMEEAVEICKLRLFLKLVAQVESVIQIEPLPDIDFNIRAGNTLVGFARMEDYNKMIDNPLGLKTDADALAELLAKNVSEFHKQQLEQGSGDQALKKNIQDQLEALAIRFDQELAIAYGFFPKKIADKTKAEKLEEFKETHKPFHWCIEFFKIMSRGGFDAIIGNPPYVEYSKVKKEYNVVGYQTESCGNLYSFVIERCLNIQIQNGMMAMIVQLPIICTDRMIPLQKLCTDHNSPIWFSNFDDRPGKLFDGLQHIRATIFIAQKNSGKKQIFSTTYNRWYSEARSELFERLAYQNISDTTIKGTIPKIGNPLSYILWNKLTEFSKLENSLDTSNKNLVYFHNAPQYWIRAMTFIPYFWNKREGEQISTQVKSLLLSTKQNMYTVAALLNSSLFYWWFIILSDCRHLNLREIETFPVGIEKMSEDVKNSLMELAQRLMTDLKKHKKRKEAEYKATGKVVYDEFFPKHSKPIIDEIDRVLAKHYDFTDEELDFIINYDVKYRMGQNNEEEE
jgi:hypothetical protein